MAHEAALELIELLAFLRRSLQADAERDEALPAWRCIAQRAEALGGALVSVLGGDEPEPDELAKELHGHRAHWPAWLSERAANSQGGAHG